MRALSDTASCIEQSLHSAAAPAVQAHRPSKLAGAPGPGPDVRGDRTREQNRMECAPGVLSLKSTFRCFFRLGVMAYAKLYRLLRKRFYVYIRSFTQTLTYTKLHGLTTLNSQVLTVP